MHDRLDKLKRFLRNTPQANYQLESRAHPLRTYTSERYQCFVKREDELGGVFCGSKLRKYRTLIPFFIAEGFSEVVVIGGAYSNNVLGITQLLIENGIKPTLFLRGQIDLKPKGNSLFSKLLVPPDSIHWIPRENWDHVHAIAEEYIKKTSWKAFILPEGASTQSAFPGSLTLAVDILRNETELGLKFDHVFIDAGTGMMASSLILALAWLQKLTIVHVVMMADREAEFDKTLKELHLEMEMLLAESFTISNTYRCYHPHSAKSFGSTNKAIFDDIRKIARGEGFFCDPIYTAKLFSAARIIIEQKNLSGKVLMVHSGGTFTLAGFQESLN